MALTQEHNYTLGTPIPPPVPCPQCGALQFKDAAGNKLPIPAGGISWSVG